MYLKIGLYYSGKNRNKYFLFYFDMSFPSESVVRYMSFVYVDVELDFET